MKEAGLNHPNKTPEEQPLYDAIYAQLVGIKQQNQNDYESAIATGTNAVPRHYQYDATPGSKSPARTAGPGRGAAPAPAKTQGTYSESEIRQAAVARGKDPEQAIALARKRGVLK